MSTEPNLRRSFSRRETFTGIGFIVGSSIGVAIGAATDNMGLWITFGAAFGLIFGAALAALPSRDR